MRIVTRYILLTLLISWILGYQWKFQNLDFIWEPFGFRFFPFMFIPGIVALIFLRFIYRDKILSNFLKFGNWKFWLAAFLYPVLLCGLIIVAGYLFDLIKFQNPKNLETVVLGLFFDLPLLFVWFVPSVVLAEFGWRSYLYVKTSEFVSPIKSISISSLVWAFTFLPISLYYYVESANFQFGITLILSYILMGFVFWWFYSMSGSIWVSAFLHFNWILWNSFLFGSVFNEFEPVFIGKNWITNLNGVFGIIFNFLLLIPLYYIKSQKSTKEAKK